MMALPVLRRLAEQYDHYGLLEACLGVDDVEPAVQVLAALASARLGDLQAADRILTAIDADALTVDARIDLAAVHLAAGRLDPALALLQCARQDPTLDPASHALLLARLAWCRLQQGREHEARRLYEQSLAHQPMLAVYHNLLRLYRDGGQPADMARCLDAARRFWSDEEAHWPDELRRTHGRRLRAWQLDLWLARDQLAVAEAWVDDERPRRDGEDQRLDAEDWCALVADLAERLVARDQHAQAEDWLRTGLRHHPADVLLHTRLAELAQLQGRPLEAIAWWRRAIAQAHARRLPVAWLLARLSGAALRFAPGLAREAAEQARERLSRRLERDTAGPGDAADVTVQVEVALAAVEAEERRHDDAQQRYQRVLQRQPHAVPALQGLGRLHLQLGRIDDAAALFQRVSNLDPRRGYGALMQLHRFPEDPDTLQRLERLARTPDTDGSTRAALLFPLAAAWERHGDYARAFALADEANAATRVLLRYDPQAHRQHCARIRHAFPAALYEHRPACGHESTLPVFVVGMPRSGTTLVEQMLAGHSRIHGAGELGIIPRVIAGLERWERHTGSGRRYPDCVDDLDAGVTRGIAETILAELSGHAPHAQHVVDKLPHNFENIGLIRLLFPRARIISVRRDPRDIAVSNYFTDFASKHGGMGFAYDLDWIGEQLADHNLLMHHWRQIWPQAILEVHYEDVVTDPESSARRMLDHLGVPWEPRVLEFHALKRPVRTASVWQVRQPLYTSSRARWRHYQPFLTPLIRGTNRRIRHEPVEMVNLPEPGWLNAGVDRYRRGDLDGAEQRFKRLLHHVPEHAAAGFMLGLVYLHQRRHGAAVELMEAAVARCPWNRNWHDDLARARGLASGNPEPIRAHRERQST